MRSDNCIRPMALIVFILGAFALVAPPNAWAEDCAELQRTVEQGDTLSRIALEEWGNAGLYPKMFHANRDIVLNPDRIYPGMTLTFPREPSCVDVTVADKSVVLATSHNYEPFANPGAKHGEIENGFTVEIAQTAFEKAGYDVTLKVMNQWTDVERATRHREVDAAVPYAKRETGFKFSDPVYDLYTVFFADAENPPIPSDWSPSDLDGLKACKPKGYFTWDINDYLDSGQLELVRGDASIASCFVLLEQGKVDLVVVNPHTGWKTLRDSKVLEPSDFAVARKPAGEAPMRIMIAEDHPNVDEMIRDVNTALDHLDESGWLQDTRNKGLSRFYQDVLADVERSYISRDPEGTPSPDDEAVELVTGNNYPPWADEELPGGGLATVIVRVLIEQRLEKELDLSVVMPWIDAQKAVAEGRKKATFPYIERPDSDFYFSEPIARMRVHIFVSANDPAISEAQVNEDAAYSGLTACKPTGYYTLDIDGLIESGRIDLVRAQSGDMAECFEMLASGDADFVSVSPTVAASAIQRSEYEEARFLDQGSYTTVGLRLMARDDEEGRAFINEVNEEIALMRENNELQRIAECYFNRPDVQECVR